MFCTKCGNAVGTTAAATPVQHTLPPTVSSPAVPPPAGTFGGVTPDQSKAPPQQRVMPRKKLPLKPFIIAGSILIVIAITAIILFIPHYKADTRETVDVYARGAVGKYPNNKAVFWKNGKLVELPGGDKSEAYSIYVPGNDVYVGGSFENHIFLWKNGKIVRVYNRRNGWVIGNVFLTKK